MRNGLLVSLAVLLLSGCVTMNSQPGWLPSTLSADAPYLQQLSLDKVSTSLKSVGQDTDVRLMQSSGLGLVHHAELERLLNDELQHIKDTSGFSEIPGQVYILASPTMNALVTADGNIFVPIAMLVDIQSLDEASALLAHEFAHTVLGHTNADLLKDIQKKGTTAYGIVNRLGMSDNAEQVGRRIRNSVALYMATERIISPTWTRKQETDADRLAIDFLVAAGRNVDGMTALLGRLEQWEKINVQLREQDHPAPSMLVGAAVDHFAQNEWQELLIKALDPIGRQLEDGMTQVSETHLGGVERLDNVNSYVRAHYRTAARPAIDNQRWQRVAHSAVTRRLAQGVVHSHNAYRLANQGNVAAARKTLANVNRRTMADQTFYRVSTAIVADEQRRLAEVVPLAQSQSGPYPSYRLTVMAGRAHMQQQGKLEPSALDTLYEQFDHYGRPPEFYYDLIEMAQQSDYKRLELELALRCRIDNFGDMAACSAPQNQSGATGDSGVVGGLLNLFGKK